MEPLNSRWCVKGPIQSPCSEAPNVLGDAVRRVEGTDSAVEEIPEGNSRLLRRAVDCREDIDVDKRKVTSQWWRMRKGL